MKIFLMALLLSLCAPSVMAGIVAGTVTDRDTGEPVAYATIRVEGTGRSMLANEQGQYRLMLDPGAYSLKFSHVAHYSERFDVRTTDSTLTLDVTLKEALILVPGTRVYGRAYDPAQEIILQAIARKEEILSQLQHYEFDAYTRLVVRNAAKSDSDCVELITETQLVCFWEYPNKYKEEIVARRQTSNLDAESNLVSLGQILNFNENRIDLGLYSVVSPTAHDALKHYNYYLLDTVLTDGQPVFRLEIEPKNQLDPLFVGTIDIADSSFAVVGVDVGFSEGIDLRFFKELRYSQRYAEFDDEYWLPVEIRFKGIVDLPIPGLPVYAIDYVGTLHNYDFDVEISEGTFDYALEVADDADDLDSATWDAGQLIPLTQLEHRGYEFIDSITNAPRPPHKIMLSGVSRLLAKCLSNYDFFHFNRVEGAYLGYGYRRHDILPRTRLDTKLGYAFSQEYWQYRGSLSHSLCGRKRLDVVFEYHDQLTHRPTLISSSTYNPTVTALFNKTDPFDYYREKGLSLALHSRIVKYTGLGLTYHDYRQDSESNNTEYSFFRESKMHRLNPGIVDGRLRSLAAGFTYDSRELMRLKHEEIKQSNIPFTVLKTGVEVSSPDFVNSDFDFVRYYVWFWRAQRTLGTGLTTIELNAGRSDRALPPQRYFTVDFGDEILGSDINFKTLGETNFAGSRALAVYASHYFGRWLFKRSGVPIIRDIPLSLSAYGGVFWTDFKGHPAPPGDDEVRTASDTPYSEIGFGIGGMRLMVLNLYFTWQLSAYDTNDFWFSFGLGF